MDNIETTVVIPHSGSRTHMSTSTSALESGEFYLECPDTGRGTGRGRIKVGDGITPYSSLPYFVGDTEDVDIPIDDLTSVTTVDDALSSVVSGGILQNLISALKRSVFLLDGIISTIKSDFDTLKTSITTVKSTINGSSLGEKLGLTSTSKMATITSVISGVTVKTTTQSVTPTKSGTDIRYTVPKGYYDGTTYVKATIDSIKTAIG